MAHWDIDSIAPGLLVLATIFALAHIVATRDGFYRNLLAAQATGRYGQIDGLRGFLAPAVLLSHIVSSYYWYHTGRWGWPPSSFYTLCGSVPVSLFFMITGFLFWRRAAAMPGRMDVKALLRSRLRRLAPLYLACVIVVITIVGIETHWTLVVPPLALITTVGKWASFGLFGFPNINGLVHTWRVDPALWTLHYEWLFYLALPGLSFLATPRRLAGLALAGAILSATGRIKPLDYIFANFLVGMVVAQVMVARPLPKILQSRGMAILALLPIIGLSLGDGNFSITESLALAPLFTIVVAGNDFFGSLSSRAARCLGVVSYSTYVLHSIILYIALNLMSRFFVIGNLDPAIYWVSMLPIAMAVAAVSVVSYRWIEHPFLASPSAVAKPNIQITHATAVFPSEERNISGPR